MKSIKTHVKVLVLSFIVLMAVVAGGTVYLNDYYSASETAQKTIDNTASKGVVVTRGPEGHLVFTPLYSAGIDKALIFYPGGKVEYTAYAPLMQKLAKKGIMCVLVKMPANFALFHVNAAKAIQQKYPSVKEWYIAGHSLGGVAAAMHMEKENEKYEGIVLLGSYSSVNLSQTSLRALLVYGENDQVMNREEFKKCRANLPAGYQEVMIEGGNHAGFGDYGLQRGDGMATISRDEQQEKTAEIIAEWMGE